MNIELKGKTVRVTGCETEAALSSPLLKKWLETLSARITIHGIHLQSVDIVRRQGKDHVLFIKLKAELTDEEGHRLPGIVFLRGGSVGLFVVLETEVREYALLIKSTLPAIGIADYPQLPAGMLDGEEDAALVAVREIEEETGFVTQTDDLVDLTQEFWGGTWKGIYPSPGACDEFIKLFLYRRKSTEEEVQKLEGKLTGLRTEHEFLALTAAPLDDLCRVTPDVKVHSAYLLYLFIKKQKETYGHVI